jgi:hypothetical protein
VPIVVTVALAFAGPVPTVRAAEPVAPTAPSASKCAAPEFQAMRFKIGRFRVVAATGQLAGHSEVVPILDGCALEERWRAAAGSEGRAWFAYDPPSQTWHMLFVNSLGETLSLKGPARSDGIALEGVAEFAGYRGLHRMLWSPAPQGGVRQFWQVSRDGGQSWERIFDGRYTREE